MPQISPIFWSLIVILVTTLIASNSESLASIGTKTIKNNILKTKEKSMKW